MSTIVEILTGKGDVEKLYTVAKDIVDLKNLSGNQYQKTYDIYLLIKYS